MSAGRVTGDWLWPSACRLDAVFVAFGALRDRTRCRHKQTLPTFDTSHTCHTGCTSMLSSASTASSWGCRPRCGRRREVDVPCCRCGIHTLSKQPRRRSGSCAATEQRKRKRHGTAAAAALGFSSTCADSFTPPGLRDGTGGWRSRHGCCAAQKSNFFFSFLSLFFFQKFDGFCNRTTGTVVAAPVAVAAAIAALAAAMVIAVAALATAASAAAALLAAAARAAAIQPPEDAPPGRRDRVHRPLRLALAAFKRCHRLRTPLTGCHIRGGRAGGGASIICCRWQSAAAASAAAAAAAAAFAAIPTVQDAPAAATTFAAIPAARNAAASTTTTGTFASVPAARSTITLDASCQPGLAMLLRQHPKQHLLGIGHAASAQLQATRATREEPQQVWKQTQRCGRGEGSDY
eukprot:354519-Chlamydomonas_euryale.AAC.4